VQVICKNLSISIGFRFHLPVNSPVTNYTHKKTDEVIFMLYKFFVLYKLLYWRNRGENDYAEHNRYHHPNSELEIVHNSNERLREKMRAENRAYREGYANAIDEWRLP
jgi:hypothetical protein